MRGANFGDAHSALSSLFLPFVLFLYLESVVAALLLKTDLRGLQSSLPQVPSAEFLRSPHIVPSKVEGSLKKAGRGRPAAWLGIGDGSLLPFQDLGQRDTGSKEQELPHLLVFVGEGCTYCERVAEPLRLVEEQTGEKVLRLEVWHNALNYELLQRLDRGRCGGLPFFVNLRTGAFICGATNFRNLLLWAAGLPCNSHEPSPPLPEELEAAQRKTGPLTRVMRRVERLRRESQEKMAAQLRNEICTALDASHDAGN